jgi:hypothetical protein
MSTIVFGGFPGVGKRSIISRMLEIGSSTIVPVDSTDNRKWNLKTKYFTADLIPRIVENPSELNISEESTEPVIEVCWFILYTLKFLIDTCLHRADSFDSGNCFGL